MNRFCFVGFIGADPEVKKTKDKQVFANFPLYVRRNFKNDEGEYESDVFRISVSGKRAEFVRDYFKKGMCVFVEGQIRNSSTEDDDGEVHYYTNYYADSVGFAGNSKSSLEDYDDDEDEDEHSTKRSTGRRKK